MRGTLMSAFFGVALAGCLGAPAVSGTGGKPSGSGGEPDGLGTGGTGSGGIGSGGNATIGTGGSTGSGGAIGTGGSTGSGGATGTGGSTGSGGATGTGGSTGSGGTIGTGGAGTGGRMGTGGATGTGGGAAGMTGTAGTIGTTPAFNMPLRLEDTCGSIQSTSTCLHKNKATDDALPYSDSKTVTMGGTPGTMYMVKIRIVGVVEPTTISGGTVGTPKQFVTGGSAAPDNGNSGAGAYNQWRLTTTVPNQSYYLNTYTSVNHNIYLIDYTETIMIGGGTTLKLDVHDSNAHLITNTAGSGGGPVTIPTGIMPLAGNNVGQFVEIDIVSAQ